MIVSFDTNDTNGLQLCVACPYTCPVTTKFSLAIILLKNNFAFAIMSPPMAKSNIHPCSMLKEYCFLKYINMVNA